MDLPTGEHDVTVDVVVDRIVVREDQRSRALQTLLSWPSTKEMVVPSFLPR